MKIISTILALICIIIFVYGLWFIFHKNSTATLLAIGGTIAYVIYLGKKSKLL